MPVDRHEHAVTAEHLPLVGVMHGPGQGLHQPGGLTWGQRGAAQAPVQAAATAKLHAEIRLAFVFADLENLHDIGVLQVRCRPRLPLEAFQRMGVLLQFGGEELERHPASEPGVIGLVNDAHSTTSEATGDGVLRDARAEKVISHGATIIAGSRRGGG